MRRRRKCKRNKTKIQVLVQQIRKKNEKYLEK